jgi:hypothetical protein
MTMSDHSLMRTDTGTYGAAQHIDDRSGYMRQHPFMGAILIRGVDAVPCQRDNRLETSR